MFSERVANIEHCAQAMMLDLKNWLPQSLCHLVVQYGSAIELLRLFDTMLSTLSGDHCEAHHSKEPWKFTLCFKNSGSSILHHSAINIMQIDRMDAKASRKFIALRVLDE